MARCSGRGVEGKRDAPIVCRFIEDFLPVSSNALEFVLNTSTRPLAEPVCRNSRLQSYIALCTESGMNSTKLSLRNE